MAGSFSRRPGWYSSARPPGERARRLIITRSDGIAHQQLLNELSDVDLLIIDLCRYRNYADMRHVRIRVEGLDPTSLSA